MCSSIKGQPFSETDLAADREAILNYYYDLGYPNPSFETSVTFTPDKRDAIIEYSIAPGSRKFVNQVIVRGLRTTRRNLVLNRIELHEGDPLSLTRQTDSQRNLYNLGIFARVNSAILNPGGDEDDKDVLIDIDEAKQYSFNAGAGAQIARIGGGVTSLDNPAGTTGFSPRLTLGITRDNFLGLGQRIGLQTALSTIEQRGTLTYFIPQFASNPDLSLTTVALIDNSNDIRTYTAQRREASVQLGQRISKAFTSQYRLLFRHVTLNNVKIDQLLVPLLSQPETVGMAEVSLIEDKRDDPTDSHHGTYTTLDLGYAPSFLGSQTHFGRLLSRNSSYYQLTRDLVLARSTQFGFIARTGGRPEIPLAERLYSGGSTSIRAFPDFQAGPRDLVTGFPLGGNALFINNVELRFPLYGDNINGVLFQDAGNVYSSLGNFNLGFRQENLQDFNYMVQDVGFGIRYRTPIGPIRVDLSLSPDAPRFFGLKGTFQDYLNGTAPATVQKINAFQFHISLGQAF
jgi:outer membrane protein assembly complex protein YaeT